MTDKTEQENKQGVNITNKIEDELKDSAIHPEIVDRNEIDNEHDPIIDEELHLEDEQKTETENEIKESPVKGRKKKDRNDDFDVKAARRLLKSEPVGNKKERLNKVRIEFQKRILTKLGFFNSVRAQEKKWGVKKDVHKSRMATQTAGEL